MFFGDPNFHAVWRFSPSQKLLTPIIPRVDILIPNGICVNKDFTKLYDLDEEGWPSNKRLISFGRHEVLDGLHIDDAGRIWTGEYGGVVVGNLDWRVLGLLNSEALLRGGGMKYELTNFALAGDVLVILAVERIWTIRLSNVLIDLGRYKL
ncbi:hypothetical protein BDZ45DRAFT_733303 [Acephala macrosclerotiorum]|nr:hypothetical protein BDZ45DRAFT_733303 [Acephala macrosclerotiorum]